MMILGQGAAAAGEGSDDIVFDVGDHDFMARVVEASKQRPIIVDFWAPWCGPCKTLGPALEAAVRAANGKVALAKIDIDQHPGVAGQLRIQSIPTVYAFVDGQPVDGFMGALPASQLQQFVDKLAKQAADPAGDLESAIEAAEAALSEGALSDAAQIFGAVLGQDPTEFRALGGLARCYAANGDLDRARQTLAMAPEEAADEAPIKAARIAIELAETTAGAGARLAENRAKLDANAGDLDARFDLALGLLALGDREGAVTELLEVFRRDRDWRDDAAKTQLMKLFDVFGPNDPVTLSGRRRLSSMIFA